MPPKFTEKWVSTKAPKKKDNMTTRSIIAFLLSGVVISIALGLEPQARLSAPPGPPHANKGFGNFTSFYPHYRAEHSNWDNQVLHMAGTSLSTAWFLRNPGLIAPLSAAVTLGFMACPLLLTLPNGLMEMALIGIVYYTLALIATRNWARPLVPLLFGYGFAWAGHFFFEKNIPATFTYPTYSLLGDYRMFYDNVMMLTAPYR